MTGLSPHQVGVGQSPNSEIRWRNWYPKRVKVKISYISSIPAAHAKYSATNVIPSVGALAAVKRLLCNIFQFAPYISQGAKISSPQ